MFIRKAVVVLGVLCVSAVKVATAQSTISAQYKETADRIIAAATADSAAWDRLALMTDTFGHRLSGSEALERTIDWVLAQMKADGLANAHTEPVMVPHWVRGKESAELISPRPKPLPMLGLGGSVGTPKGGITAPVLVVSSFDDFKAHQDEAKGKIILWDAPFTEYGQTVAYRALGANVASQHGALASLIRTVGPASIASPHTGALRYDSTIAKIPAAALTLEDAAMLHRMQDRGQKIVVHLEMEARTLPDAPSRNVMAELVGREHPEQVVVLGGHIDSWDVGQGAMDDGDGVVVSWQAVKLLQKLGLHPRRTIRVVAWTNEENGTRGGQAYRDARGADVDKHVLAMESDGGTFKPVGFDFVGSDSAFAILQQIMHLLKPVGADSIVKGGGEADVGPLLEKGVPGLGLRTDPTRYFWYHHSQGDTMDKLDPADMARDVAVMAVMAYVVADMPEPLPRGAPPAPR